MRLVVLTCLVLIGEGLTFRCGRIPTGVYKPRNRNDAGRYILDIPGNPKTYTPSARYNITLKLNPLSITHRTFKSFIVTLEQETNSLLGEPQVNSVGQFFFGEDMLAKFSDRCPNTVIEANSLPKSEVQIFWTAPPADSGCVALRATVVESRDNWFSEDGPLTKILCAETSENENVQPMVLNHCCACDEAKYEVAFEGLWTRNTHPKDFPSDVWSTKFSDVVGASHKLGHSFWEYGNIASEGLRDLAEIGDTKNLESELKESSEDIRTIIKARGLQYPNITLSTFAVFRVDNQNHLVSLVSKIIPSPDWIVGVANLELCRINCTWEESRVLNLYPWDAGTDDGATYTSPDEPSGSKQPIRRIKSNSPNDPRSPFYDESGEEMKPIARLHLTRQRLYEKVCDGTNEPPEEGADEESCAVGDWLDWSLCTKTCGRGTMFRQRHFVNPEAATNCNRIMVEEKECFGQGKNCEETEDNEEPEEEQEETALIDPEDPRCALSDWSRWSSCSVTCGQGSRTRDKKMIQPIYASACNLSPGDLQETQECEGDGDNCENFEADPIVECEGTKWSDWSPCSVTCGNGHKTRNREPLEEAPEEEEDCEDQPNQEIVKCFEPCDEEPEPTDELFTKMDTEDQRSSSEIVSQGPDGEVINCKVTKWSSWSSCKPSKGRCGKGYRTRVRQIRVHPVNGGVACPSKLVKKRKCKISCDEDPEEEETLPSWGEPSAPEDEEEQEPKPDECVMSKWSRWSPCSTICGSTAVQQRTRSILRRPQGATCPTRIEQKRCPLPLACGHDGLPIF